MDAGEKRMFLSPIWIFSMTIVEQEIVHYCRFPNLMYQQLKKTAKRKHVEVFILKNAIPLSVSH